MLNSTFSGRSLLKVTPVVVGDRRSKSVGAFSPRSQPATDSTPAATSIAGVRGITYLAGRIRIACPPPGARTTRRFETAVTVRFEIVTGSGLVNQCAPGPSAYTSAM